ncbi:MAG: tetratricopeptide repeat protein, partial [Kiritimatiellae bacterium]|nr:tetratricopeptide repeat protein [Kiritimatiellia bacterium]
LGLSREIQGNVQGALEAFLKAIEKDPGNESLYMLASKRLVESDRSEEAFHLLEILLTSDPENVTALRWMANLHLQQNQPEKAQPLLKRAVSLHPSSEQVYLEAMQAFSSNQNLDDILEIARLAHQYAEQPIQSTRILVRLLGNAIQSADDVQSMLDRKRELDAVLDRAVSDFPDKELFPFIQAEIALEENRFDEAFDRYRFLDKRSEDPEQTRSRILVHALQSSGSGPEGARLVQLQLEQREQDPLAQYLLGLLHELQDQGDRAFKAYQRASELSPDDLPTLRKRVLLHYQRDQLIRARELLTRIRAEHPDDPQMLQLAGQIALATEDFGAASSYLQQRMLKHRQGMEVENPAGLYAQMAMALLVDSTDPQAATDALFHAADEPGHLEWVWRHQLQQILNNRETDPDEAERLTQRTFDTFMDLSDRLPGNPEVEFLIGKTHGFEQDYENAIPAFERAIQLAEQADDSRKWLTTGFYYDLAAAYERAGRIESSVAAFEKIIARNPDHHPALNYLAYMWADRGENLDRALEYVNRALKLEPDNGAYLDTLGWIYYQQGQFEDAYRELLKSAELDPDEPVILEHLGDVLMKLGRPLEARAYYRITLELGPVERMSIIEDSLSKANEAVSASFTH